MRIMLDYQLEHLFSYTATGGQPQVVGPGPSGIRVVFGISGGEVSGPRLRGRVLPGGGDWLTLRPDGVAMIDVRITLETHDGALIYSAYTGLGDFGADGYDKMLRGELPPVLKVRGTPRFETAHPAYLWLNRIQALNVGEADFTRMVILYDLYAVR